MRLVKYVPADARVRAERPDSCMLLQLCANPNRGNFGMRTRKPTGFEADRAAYPKGWVRLSELKPAERRAWLKRYRQSA